MRPTGETRTMTTVAYSRLKDDILAMRLVPRQSLVESELAAMLHMSKTPVREALLTLSHDGLVEINEFRGARVREFDLPEVREIYELRAVLEPLALRRAFPAMTIELFVELRRLLDQALACAEAGDRVRLAEHNRAFHSGLIRCCDNQRLLGILSQFSDQIRLISLRSWVRQPTYLIEADEHRSILDALEVDHDIERAVELLTEHILHFFDRIQEAPRP
ncbi:GntR family transcriptional regulator [soil metagenome]